MNDGEDEDSPVLGTFCGHRFPWIILGSGSNIFMKLEGVIWKLGQDVINVRFEAIGRVFNAKNSTLG